MQNIPWVNRLNNLPSVRQKLDSGEFDFTWRASVQKNSEVRVELVKTNTNGTGQMLQSQMEGDAKVYGRARIPILGNNSGYVAFGNDPMPKVCLDSSASAEKFVGEWNTWLEGLT